MRGLFTEFKIIKKEAQNPESAKKPNSIKLK